MGKDTELIDRVAQELQRADIPFRQKVAVGGATPDFVVHTPNGPMIVIEVKEWQKTPRL